MNFPRRWPLQNSLADGGANDSPSIRSDMDDGILLVSVAQVAAQGSGRIPPSLPPRSTRMWLLQKVRARIAAGVPSRGGVGSRWHAWEATGRTQIAEKVVPIDARPISAHRYSALLFCHIHGVRYIRRPVITIAARINFEAMSPRI